MGVASSRAALNAPKMCYINCPAIGSSYSCITPGASDKLGGLVRPTTVKAAFRVVLARGIAFRVVLAALCLLRVSAPTSLLAVASDLALKLKPGVIERR
jgi:hypothetical protein